MAQHHRTTPATAGRPRLTSATRPDPNKQEKLGRPAETSRPHPQTKITLGRTSLTQPIGGFRLTVSAIGFGAMALTPVYGELDDTESLSTLHRTVE